MFIHTPFPFAGLWKLSNVFLRFSQNYFNITCICTSYEKWKLHELWHLIVSTMSVRCVRFRWLDNTKDQRYYLSYWSNYINKWRCTVYSEIFELVRFYHRGTEWFWRQSSHLRRYHVIWFWLVEDSYHVFPATVMIDFKFYPYRADMYLMYC